jgi:uncharacterized protein (DUF3084 family)
MPSDGGVATTLMNIEFERWRRERLANRHFWSVEQENLALKQDIDQLLARYNQLVAEYNALLESRKQLAINYEKMRDICRRLEADYQRLEVWAKEVAENGHPGRKK